MRKVLISCAVLAAACTGGDEAEAPVVAPTTETPSDLIAVGAEGEVETAVTTTTEVATTTTEPATTTTVEVTTTHTHATPRRTATTTAYTAPTRSSSTPPDYIKQCESGGSYTAVNPNGHYGAWQFSQSTWESVGGTGRPDHASPAEQDYRASILWDGGNGASHWECA